MIEIRNDNVLASIHSVGAELQELCLVGKENVIWRKNTKDWNRFAPLLFPIVGRLLNDRYSHHGIFYEMKQHGFARDCEFTVIHKERESVSLLLTSNEKTKIHYPFDFELIQRFELCNNTLKISSNIINLGETPMLYSIGGHPGFHVEGNLEDYYLDFGGQMLLDQHLISGNFYNGKVKPLELSREFYLSKELFEVDAIVFKQVPFNHISFCHKKIGKILTISCKDWTALGLWTKAEAPFFCIEPWWGWADDLSSNGNLKSKNGIIALAQHEQRTHEFSIELT
ncbi:MAG: hypothetical protein RL037_2067 [Bacteroidota bacterium]